MADALGNPLKFAPDPREKRGPGRPKTASAPAPKTAPRAAGGRPVARKALREGQVIGRNGEVLTRNRVSGDGYYNEFDIPMAYRDNDFDLQWARVSCHGKPDNANINELYDNGWRPASPKNYAKVMPDQASKATIERDGLMLMERPWILTQQALEEQRGLALELREIQGETFGKRKLPKGFTTGRKARDGNFNAAKMLNRTLEQSPREAKPSYVYATGDDD